MKSLIQEAVACVQHLTKHPVELYNKQRDEIRAQLEKADANAANKVLP